METKPVSSNKCENKLAYNVSGLFFSVPTNQGPIIFEQRLNVKLLAASALLAQSGALLVTVSVNIKLALGLQTVVIACGR